MKVHLYPDYRITEEENKVHELRQLKKERHAVINKALMSKESELEIEQCYFVSLRTNEAHKKVHLTGIIRGVPKGIPAKI